MVGLNGTGKSTLFKILAGLEDYDEGKIVADGESIAYLPRELRFDMRQTIKDYLYSSLEYPELEYWKIEVNLYKLGLSNVDINAEINTLSPGQKMKLYLAQLFLKAPTVLLLDEPTNHLDIESKEVIEQALFKFKGAILLVSHDRYFANSIGINKLLTISDCRLSEFPR